ncbi:hypothetical protein [Saccharomonospora azurea]|uniref:Uncharacterized protein n=1 Tax=Saccharomonospora azurea NA-128 TaxID=882081 RepID=H8G709_9PSEU|nr:hypothetical protein [Saccharomonospora azurea]EHY87278.1 hypothetical protein SacazDRAFT_00297 [Saccharomonospora azurea NA-128]
MNTPTTHPRTAEELDGSREAQAIGEVEQTVLEISAALAELRLTRDAIGNKEWLSADLAGEPSGSLDQLGSITSPLSTLSSAGCDFLTPMISFLEEPLGRLRGEPEGVSGPAGQHDAAARDAGAVAEDFGSSVESETSEWAGAAKDDYLGTATQLVDGVLSIAETAGTNAKAMIAAGEVVAQVVGIVTQLITEAVATIVPIMTRAIAAAPATFGASIAQAIPDCVAIAVDYAGRIAGKLGELIASGENLVTLIEGAVGVLKVVREGLTVIGDLAGGDSASSASAAGTPVSTVSGQDGVDPLRPLEREASRGEPAKSLETDEPGRGPGEFDDPLEGEWKPVGGVDS